MFSKILIANRGEIACRIIESARRLNILTVAIYSDADRRARHVRMADEAIHIGGAASVDSYLKGTEIIKVAKSVGAQAIHPGYGFLSENEGFAKACEKEGIKFIGPSAKAIHDMGLKDRAKVIMEKAGVPVVPGYKGSEQGVAKLKKEAETVGYPVLIKAVAGGGGKGMRLVEKADDFKEALQSCKREAKASFGNDHVLIEKFIGKPRHVEVQVFGDSYGQAVYLFERDCSLQRRHQKVVEEAPAPGLSEAVRKELGEAAVRAVKALSYENAGTIEFIMDSKTKEFFFMEMNTRLQVEHPVTEMITGLDLVEWQLLIANGEKLPLSQKQIKMSGHAFEVRLYAEDPSNEFLPQTGRLTHFSMSANARTDTGVETGDSVSIYYDPMIAKLIVHADDRKAALKKMRDALSATLITGLNTNQEFLSRIFDHKEFIKGSVDTGFIERYESDLIPSSYGSANDEITSLLSVWLLMGLSYRKAFDPWCANDNWRMGGAFSKKVSFMNKGAKIEVNARYKDDAYTLEFDKKKLEVKFLSNNRHHLSIMLNGKTISGSVIETGYDLTVFHQGHVTPFQLSSHGGIDDEDGGEGKIITPMPGKVIDVLVKKGDKVSKNQPLLILEAMKMEMTIRAGLSGVIEELAVSSNDQVGDGALLVFIKEGK
jgi:3-methylcrotonyl-CoA carboxylase alpha subunit